MSRGGLIAAAVVAAATLFAHAPAWRGDFVSDDIAEIAENPAIRVLWPPWVPMFEGTRMPHRPLPYYSFALNYAAHGLDPRGYHAVNLAIHLANGWLVWRVGREILRRLGGGEAAGSVALAATTLWLVHPLCTQAVDYIYQRIESLGALAILGTVACFLRAGPGSLARASGADESNTTRARGWLAASVAASAMGMLCKEHVAAAPIAVLLIDWLAVRWRRDAPWRSLPLAAAARPVFYAALFATPLIAVALVAWQRERFTDFEHVLAGPLLYAANQPLVIGEYLRRAVIPAPLCIDWYRIPREDPAVLAAGILAVGAALSLAAWAVNHARGLALAILLFLALLSPTSSLLPVNDLMVEHRMYLPLAVLCTGTAAAGHALLSRYCPAGRRLVVGGAIVGIVAALLAAATWARCHAYRSRLVMWADVVMKSPRNPRGWQTLAVELWQAGMLDRALEAVDRSLLIVPDSDVTIATRRAILADIEQASEPGTGSR